MPLLRHFFEHPGHAPIDPSVRHLDKSYKFGILRFILPFKSTFAQETCITQVQKTRATASYSFNGVRFSAKRITFVGLVVHYKGDVSRESLLAVLGEWSFAPNFRRKSGR